MIAVKQNQATGQRVLAIASVTLAAGLAANSILGPLVTGVIRYRYTETYNNQAIGLDAFALAIAAPLLLLVAWLSLRAHKAAPYLALGPSLMAAYMVPQYILGAHYTDLPGNNEKFFLFHLGLFVLGAAVSLLASHATGDFVPAVSRKTQTWSGILLFAVAGFLVVRYLPLLTDTWKGQMTPEYADDPIASWLIAFMDLGIVMPAAVATGTALIRGVAAAQRTMYAVVAWFALVGPAVASMGYAEYLRDDPNGSLAGAVVFTIYGAAFALLAAYLFRPLFKGRYE